jgi:hypothetical protein
MPRSASSPFSDFTRRLVAGIRYGPLGARPES